MSSYDKLTKHPETGNIEIARWIDDYFGPHQYAVRFADGKVFDAAIIEPEPPSDRAFVPLLHAGRAVVAVLLVVMFAAVAVAQQPQVKVTIIATGGVKHLVFVDAVPQSANYSQLHTAQAAAVTLAINNPGKRITIESTTVFRVDVTGAAKPPKPPVDPDPPVDPKPDPEEPTDPDPPVDPDPEEPTDPDPEEPTNPDPEEPTDPDPEEPVDPLPSEAHTHFESLLSHPNLLDSWSLRDPDHYLGRRGGTYAGANPNTVHDRAIDAARLTIPPRHNEATSNGSFVLRFKPYRWVTGDTLVLQHDFMVSQSMIDLIAKPGTNGNGLDKYKFTNICQDGKIMIECRTHFKYPAWPGALVDFRTYRNNREGRLDRFQLASDVADPRATVHRSGGGYDVHPGPDSVWVYGQKDFRHPDNFIVRGGMWVRITYQLERVADGTRIMIWMADEETDPKLIACSVADPSQGFLTDIQTTDVLPFDQLYIELDTSKETQYEEDQPERWAAFRNVLFFKNVRGESVLGGRPIRWRTQHSQQTSLSTKSTGSQSRPKTLRFATETAWHLVTRQAQPSSTLASQSWPPRQDSARLQQRQASRKSPQHRRTARISTLQPSFL